MFLKQNSSEKFQELHFYLNQGHLDITVVNPRIIFCLLMNH